MCGVQARSTLQASKAYFLELLQIRYSSPLFRLPEAKHIKQQLLFHNVGPSQVDCYDITLHLFFMGMHASATRHICQSCVFSHVRILV